MRIPRVVHTLPAITLALALAWSVPSGRVAAQALNADTAPAHIDFVDGQALLEREGQLEPADAGMLFIPGDRLRTTNGRVEVIFPDGTVLDIDEASSVDLQDRTLLRLTTGRLLLTVAGADDPAAATLYQIDTPVASATTEGPGEYRVALLSNPTGLVTELAVARGTAFLSTERGVTSVRAGERSLAREFEAPSYPQAFNSARFDAFDAWASAQRDLRLGTVAANQYLPSELQMYGGTLARSGSWGHHASHGYVWYPSVGATWRPYYSGYWSAIRPYGWTWIGVDAWAWPTHHYGRWGHTGSRWFWVPHHQWGPAWVSWGVSSGYVGWSPLGFDNRPVFSLSVSIGSRWHGWVVVPNGYFNGSRAHVRHHAVAPHRLRSETFATRSIAPVAPRYAGQRQRGGGATVSALPASRGNGIRRAQPRIQNRPATGLGASGRPESDRAQTRAVAGRSSTARGRQPLARTREGATRSQPNSQAPSATTPRSAVRRRPGSGTAPGVRATDSSLGGRVPPSGPTARRQPESRTRRPVTASPQASTTGRRPAARTRSGSDAQPSRAAVARRPPPTTARPAAPERSVGRSTRDAIRPNRGSATRPSERRGLGGVRSEPIRSRPSSPPPQASTSSAPPRGATAPRSENSRARPGARQSPPAQQAGPRARTRSPQAQAPSGGRTSAPARAVPRAGAGSSAPRTRSGRRTEPASGSSPARAPAARRGR